MRKIFRMKEKVWLYPGDSGAWHFISLPQKESKIIRETYSAQKRGWGSLPVAVTIGKTTWKTSIFPDRRSNAYLLPLKLEVRRKEDISAGEVVPFSVQVLV